jgi:2-methylcitrate dehydratase PrpD
MKEIESMEQVVSRTSPEKASRRAPRVASAKPTAALAQFASALTWSSLNEDERKAAKRHLLDGLGACVAGVDQPIFARTAALLDRVGGSGDVPVVGSKHRTNLLSAAYLTAVNCHAIELDDGNREGSLHPGTAVVPAVLTAGYDLDADGASLLCALVAGYEVSVSLAEVLHPHASRRGFQTTGVVGGLGAAAAVARLLALVATDVEKSIGIAASTGAGIFSYLTGGGNVKKLHPGHAAREGVLAAMVAKDRIVEGPLGVAETKAGVFEAFGGITPWSGNAFDHRGGALAITRSYLKPYPCCRHIHPAIDALLELRSRHAIDPDGVERVDVGTYEAAMPHAALPFDSFTVAQLSFPFVMAAALRTGKVDLESFSEEARNDKRLAADAGRIRVTADAECCASYPKQGPARVTVTMQDGGVHTLYVAQPLGAPENPISDEDLAAKFRMSVKSRLSADAADRVIDLVWNLDRAGSVRNLVDRLCV